MTNPADVKTPREMLKAVRSLLAKSIRDDEKIAVLESRISNVENKQGYLSCRQKIAVPNFPPILRRYGMCPPEEKAAQ